MPFTFEAFQNRNLAPDQDRVDAILSLTAGSAAASDSRDVVIGFIVDTSDSMAGDRIDSVKQAVNQAVKLLDESVSFFVVTFQNEAQVASPVMLATRDNKVAAAQRLYGLKAYGGTAMSQGLAMARALFARVPDAIHQAIFLTDGKNESERARDVTAELERCAGQFECDCWGVGTDWKVGEVQEIARALLGKASLIPDPSGIQAAFGAAVQKAQAKAIKDVRLRLWTPVGTAVVFCKQVNPTIEDLTQKAMPVSAQVREYFTGTWASGEARDYHVSLRVKPGRIGEEMLAGRSSLVYQQAGAGGWVEQEEKSPAGRMFATWTADDALSSRQDDHVAHYTGQDELAQAIQQGLQKREQGDEVAATQLLGRAVQLAHQSDNPEMTTRLKKVVDVIDAGQGTVRLKRNVSKEAQMDLELESTTTRRTRKPAS
ncbi:MAG: VWA domain-containing protein [Dehalococcoidia bacterium]